MEIPPPGDIFDHPPLGKKFDSEQVCHVGDRVVLSPGGAVLVTSPGTESSNPPPQSLNDSKRSLQDTP